METFTRKELMEAIEYATDYALRAYRDDFMDYDGEDLEYIWEALQIESTRMHAPIQLCPSTSPNGEKNKYMIAPNMIAALIRTEEGAIIKSLMTPAWRQKEWMQKH